MKVLISTDNIGGVWTYTLNLAEGLRNRGVDVFIAVTGNDLSEDQLEVISTFSYEVIQTRQEWMIDPWEDIEKASVRLIEIARLVRPDIVHLNSFAFNSQPWNAPVIVVAHSCVLSWWETVLNEPAPLDWKCYKEKVSYGINNADVVVAPSNAMLDLIKRYYSPARSEVICNGADPQNYIPTEKENFVFSMGRLWDKAKNIKLLIDAAYEINYPVIIAGSLHNEVTGEIPGNVRFTGFLNQNLIRAYLSRAAVYALPVKYEPFGYTFLEAAFSGCALVTGDIPSMREIWGDTALFTDTGDSTMLAKHVNRLISDRKTRDLVAQQARDRALRLYTLDTMTNNYLRLYGNISKSGFRNKIKLEVQ